MVCRKRARTRSRSGSPLATSRGRRQRATSATRRCRVRRLMAGRPSRWYSRGIVQAPCWSSSRRIRRARVGLPRRGRPGRGRSASAAAPPVLYRWIQRRTVTGSQPSSSAMALAVQPRWDSRIITRRSATRWGPCSNRVRSQGQPARAGQDGLAYTLGGRILAAASWGRLVCGSSNDPRGYFAPALRLQSGVVRCYVQNSWSLA